MKYGQHWVVLLLLLGSLRQGLTAAKNSPEPDEQEDVVDAATDVAADCPAELILQFLQQSEQGPPPLPLPGTAPKQPTGGPTNSLAWPPPALKQGLTCTMELSQLSVAVPGTDRVCTVLSIRNNLLSILHSWQLVWQPREGLTATSASGAVLLNNTGLDDNPVQLISPAASPNVAAQGGSASLLVQLDVVPPAAPQPPSPQPNSNTSSEDSDRQKQAPAAASVRSIKPAVESVFLNGLQCTRLPLARPPPGPPGVADSLVLEDCGSAEWPVEATGLLAQLEPGANISNTVTWSDLSIRGNSKGGRNSSGLEAVNVTAVLAALRQLSCVSQLCCGLQIVPNSVVSTNSSSDTVNGTEPQVGAMDGPGAETLAEGVPSAALPSNQSLPTDIPPALQPVPAAQPSDSSNNAAGSVVGLVVAGVVAGLLGAFLIMLLRHRHNRSKQLADHLSQQVAAQQGLVRHGSGASSNGSGGAASLASIASAEWQQQQQHYMAGSSRPPVPWLRGGSHYTLPTYHTAPSHLITAAAAAARAEMSGGGVWRAGSWQGPDAYTPLGAQLMRSSSSPQTLIQPNTGSTSLTMHTPHTAYTAGMVVGTSSTGSPTAAKPIPPTGPSCSIPPSTGSSSAVCNGPGVSAGQSNSSLRDALVTGPSSLGSTWGSLRRFLGSSNRLPAPLSSTQVSESSSSGVLRPGSHTALSYDTGQGTFTSTSTSSSAAANLQVAGQHREQLSLAAYRPPLQLIQEAAPLAVAGSPTDPLSQKHFQALAYPQGPADAGLAAGAAAEVTAGGGVAISRRISPIVSVHDDTSSAASTDSLTPAAWHLTDRQMLEDTPGWLNIDFGREVRLEKKLGEGGFGQVFRARWRGEVVAAKLVPFMSLVAQNHSMSVSLVSAAVGAPDAAAAAGGTDSSQLSNMRLGVQFSSASLRAIKLEIRVLSQLSHPHIVAFKGACMAPPHICILEELAEGGSLYGRLYSRSSMNKAQRQQQHAPPHGNSSSAAQPRLRKAGTGGSSSRGSTLPPPLSVSEVLRIAIDVSEAMVYLHTLQPQVVHRDLKPQNVLLDLQGRAKVCDFGISKMKDASFATNTTRLQAGTPAYMAPEQFEGCSVTDKVDVFAFGVLLWECFEQQQPWRELSPMQIIYSVGLQKERLQRPIRCPDELWQLIEACWAQDPKDRPSFEDTLRSLQELQQQLHQQQQREQQEKEQQQTLLREQGVGEAAQQVEQQQAVDKGRQQQPHHPRSAEAHQHGKLGATAADASYGGAASQRSGCQALGQVGSPGPTRQQGREEQPGPEEQDDVDAHVAVVC